MKRALVVASVWALNAHAYTQAEYQATLERLKESQTQSAALLGRARASAGVNSLASQEQGLVEDQRTPLFMVHGDLARKQLGPGRLLFGKTYTRLIVTSEAVPCLIRLDFGQGAMSGLKLQGLARASSVDGRLVIEFGRLLLATGKAVALQAVALDSAGAYGLQAQVFSKKALAIAGAMGSSFVAGLAASQQPQVTNGLGFYQSAPATGRSAILQGVAQAALDQSRRLIDEATAEKPILVIEPETPLSILIQEEVIF